MTTFQLTVRLFHQTCVFELSWGKGQQLAATLAYPESLTGFYQEWQRVYLSYYKSALRGRIEASGSLTTPPIDWHAKLVQTEAKLLSEFHHWLRSGELFEIRAAIANSQSFVDTSQSSLTKNQETVTLFLTCTSLELERLPWEAWEIGAEFPKFGTMRIVRTPINIRQATVAKQQQHRRSKARILVILGDDTGLNFQGDKEAIGSLARIAEIEFVGWQPGQEIRELRAEISAAIADERGWDVLLFAGHSNETAITGGELAIAPHVSMSMREITPQLQLAKQRGLQFALFNSCSGLSLATSLIDLGLSQVAVMREPIHNQVAQVFLVRFLQGLAAHQDVHDSLLAACQLLKLEKHLTYPSAHLIPSLYCHPEAVLFQIKPSGIRERLKGLLPTRTEAIALSVLTLLSLSGPVQDWLLEQRLLTQAVYRQLTGQVSHTAKPPVLLVQIDEKSIREAGIADPKPMDRSYLAKLVDKLVVEDARVVGIDYLLDRPHGGSDRILAQSLQAAIAKSPHSTWLVFASVWHGAEGWLNVLPEIASPYWSLQGDIYWTYKYVTLLPEQEATEEQLPFAFLLALAYQLEDKGGINPQQSSQTDLLFQVNRYLNQEQGLDYRTIFSPSAQLRPITSFSYNLGQMWLHPIIDFSMPPGQVYEQIPAWQLLATGTTGLGASLSTQIVIIAPGGYGEAGVSKEGEDNFPLPAAVNYWFQQHQPPIFRDSFTGGEAHAYLIHHFLHRRLVVPIPDLWLLGLAVLLGKGIKQTGVIAFLQRRQRLLMVLLGGTTVYGLVSLQVYISAAVLLPWVFPVVMVGTYALPMLWRNNSNG